MIEEETGRDGAMRIRSMRCKGYAVIWNKKVRKGVVQLWLGWIIVKDCRGIGRMGVLVKLI
jgi:hypothetical protein